MPVETKVSYVKRLAIFQDLEEFDTWNESARVKLGLPSTVVYSAPHPRISPDDGTFVAIYEVGRGLWDGPSMEVHESVDEGYMREFQR